MSNVTLSTSPQDFENEVLARDKANKGNSAWVIQNSLFMIGATTAKPNGDITVATQQLEDYLTATNQTGLTANQAIDGVHDLAHNASNWRAPDASNKAAVALFKKSGDDYIKNYGVTAPADWDKFDDQNDNGNTKKKGSSVTHKKTFNSSAQQFPATDGDAVAQANFKKLYQTNPQEALSQIQAQSLKANDAADIKILQNMIAATVGINELGHKKVDGFYGKDTHNAFHDAITLLTTLVGAQPANTTGQSNANTSTNQNAGNTAGNTNNGNQNTASQNNGNLNGNQNTASQNGNQNTANANNGNANSNNAVNTNPYGEVPKIPSFETRRNGKRLQETGADGANAFALGLVMDQNKMHALESAGRIQKVTDGQSNGMTKFFMSSDDGKTGFILNQDATGAYHFDHAVDNVRSKGNDIQNAYVHAQNEHARNDGYSSTSSGNPQYYSNTYSSNRAVYAQPVQTVYVERRPEYVMGERRVLSPLFHQACYGGGGYERGRGIDVGINVIGGFNIGGGHHRHP